MGTPEELNAQFEAAASATAESMAEKIKARRALAHGSSGPEGQAQPPEPPKPDAGGETLDLATIEKAINSAIGQFRLKAAKARSLFASGSYDEALAGYEELRNLRTFQDFSNEQMSLVNQQNPRLLEDWAQERSTILTNLQKDQVAREVRDSGETPEARVTREIIEPAFQYLERERQRILQLFTNGSQDEALKARDAFLTTNFATYSTEDKVVLERMDFFAEFRKKYNEAMAETYQAKRDREDRDAKAAAERQEALKKVEPTLEQLDISVRKLEALRNTDGSISPDKIAPAKEALEQMRAAFAKLLDDDLKKAGKAGIDTYKGSYDVDAFAQIIRDSEAAVAASGGTAGTGVDKAKELEEARKALALTQKRVEDLQKLGHGLMSYLRRGSRDQVNAELAKAQTEYEAKLKEATMADRAVMIDERMKLVDAKLAAYRGGREKKSLYERYKGLSEINLDNWLQKRGTNVGGIDIGPKLKIGWGKKWKKEIGIGDVARVITRGLNARTAVSIGLFGGMVASGAYLGVGAGLAVARVRGAWSGVGAGGGTYEMINLARRALSSSLSDKQINEMSADQTVQYMASYEARASLDGMDLNKNAEYQKLAARYKSAIEAKGKKADGTELNGQELFDAIKGSLDGSGLQKKEINKERWIRRTAFVAGAVVGGTMYGWIVKKVQAAAEAKQLAEDQAQMAAISGASKTANVELPNPMHPRPVKGMPEFIKESNIPKVEGQVNLRDIAGEEPGADVSGVEAPTEPIRVDMEVTVKPGGAVTETPVAITEKPLVPKPDNVIYGEGLPGTPTGTGAVAEAKPGVGGVQTAVEGQSGAGVAKNVAEIKAGATMEFGAAGDAIVHAGKRGIEGALIDLKNTDPDRYAKMLAKLQEHYQAPNGKFENLVHRFVLDNSDGKDLNRVLSADVHISPDGELSMGAGDVKLMPPAEIPTDLAQEDVPSGAGAHNVIENPTTAGAGSKFQGIFSEQGHIPKSSGNIFAQASTPDLAESSDLSPEEAVQQAREVAAESILSPEKIAGKVEKLSDALHLVLGNKYDTFLDQIHMSAKSLNKVKDLTIGNFTEQIEDGAIDKKKFQGLIDAMVKWQEGGKISRSAFDKMPVKKVMLEIAKFYKHNS
jgi:hypothetical protein